MKETYFDHGTTDEAAIRADMQAKKLQFNPADLTVAIERIKIGKITDAKAAGSPPRVDQMREESDEKTDTTSGTTSNSDTKAKKTSESTSESDTGTKTTMQKTFESGSGTEISPTDPKSSTNQAQSPNIAPGRGADSLPDAPEPPSDSLLNVVPAIFEKTVSGRCPAHKVSTGCLLN